jgi:hypothetical protein
MRSLVGLPVMDLQHRQDTGRHTVTCMQVLQHHLTYEYAELSFQQVLQHMLSV